MSRAVLPADAYNPRAPVVIGGDRSIAVEPDAVWEALVDVGRWPAWHRGIDFAALGGPLAPGTPLAWRADRMRITSILVEVEPPRRIGWTLRMLGARGYLRWTLTPEGPGRTRVGLEESWEGLAVRILRGTLRRTLVLSREAWLDGLGVVSLRGARREDGL